MEIVAMDMKVRICPPPSFSICFFFCGPAFLLAGSSKSSVIDTSKSLCKTARLAFFL